MTVLIFLWLFLTVPWVGLQCVIVVFPDHTNSLFLLFDESSLLFKNLEDTLDRKCHQKFAENIFF